MRSKLDPADRRATVNEREAYDIMRSPITVGRNRIALKSSHHRLHLKVSHRRDVNATAVSRDVERDCYIAPPKRRR
jgi:hypothetical protein